MSRRQWLAVAAAMACGLSATGAGAAPPSPEASFATVDVLPVPTSETLMGVSFADAQHGWAVGANGTILVTTDGGSTWQRQRSGVQSTDDSAGQAPLLRSVSFADARNGFAVGQPALILATSDGGATWNERRPPPVDSIPGDGPGRIGAEHREDWSFRSVKATGPRAAYVVGYGGAILATTDDGATWSWEGDRQFGHLSAVSFPDPDHGHAVGEYVPGGTPYATLATNNGGANWEMQKAAPDQAGFAVVSFADAARGYVAGAGGRILATSDGGRHWAVQRKDTTETFQSLDLAGSRAVAAGYTDFTDGRKASLVTTGDGGETWVSRLVPGAIIWGVGFAGPSTAFAVGCADSPSGNADNIGPCRQSLVARVSFPAAPASRPGSGGSGFPLWLLIGAAVAVTALAVVLVARRRTAPGRGGWH